MACTWPTRGNPNRLILIKFVQVPTIQIYRLINCLVITMSCYCKPQFSYDTDNQIFLLIQFKCIIIVIDRSNSHAVIGIMQYSDLSLQFRLPTNYEWFSVQISGATPTVVLLLCTIRQEIIYVLVDEINKVHKKWTSVVVRVELRLIKKINMPK